MPQLKLQKSLRTQLFLRIIMVSTIALIGIALSITFIAYNSLLLSQRNVMEAADHAARDFDVFLVAIESDLLAVGDTLSTVDDINAALFQVLERNPPVFEVSFVTANGQIHANRRRVGGAAAASSVTEQPWLDVVRTHNVYWGPVDTNIYNVPFTEIAVPIYDGPTFVGSLVAQIDLTAF